MSRIDCSLLFFALSHHSSMPCKRRIWSGIMWFSKWNYELVKSFFFFFFFVSVVDGSARKDTRSLSLINNSVNEQIVWHSLVYLDLYSRVRKRKREIKRITVLILQNEFVWCQKENRIKVLLIVIAKTDQECIECMCVCVAVTY